MQLGLEVYIGIMAKSNLQSIFKKRSPTLVELTSESRDEELAGLGEQPQVGVVQVSYGRSLSQQKTSNMEICHKAVTPGYKGLLSISRVSFPVNLQFCCDFPRFGAVIMEYLSAQAFSCILASTWPGLRNWVGLWPSVGWTVFILPVWLSDIWFSTGSEWVIGASLSPFELYSCLKLSLISNLLMSSMMHPLKISSWIAVNTDHEW